MPRKVRKSPGPSFTLGGLRDNHPAPTLNPYEELEQAEEHLSDDDIQDARNEKQALTHELLVQGMSRLSQSDRDLLQALIVNGYRQETYAKILGISQAGVSHRLRQALAKVRWFTLQEGSWYTPIEIREVLSKHLTPDATNFLVRYWETGNSAASYPGPAKNYTQSSREWLLCMRDLVGFAQENPSLGRVYDAICALKHSGLKIYFRRPSDFKYVPSAETRAKERAAWVKRRMSWTAPKPPKPPKTSRRRLTLEECIEHRRESRKKYRASHPRPKKPPPTPEEKEATRLRRMGYIATEATREKLRRASTGRRHTQDAIEKLRISSTGRRHTPETREKMRASQRARRARDRASKSPRPGEPS